MMQRTTPWLVVLVLAVPLSARAQTCYVVFEPTRPAPGDEVGVQLLSGIPFGDARTVHPEAEDVKLELLWRSGRDDLGPAGPEGRLTIRPTEPGVHLVAFEQRDDTGGAGAVASFGKALLVVGQAVPGESIWRSELGHRLEIVPETDPVALAASGGTLVAQVLFRREPLPGATVVAVAEDAPEPSYRRAATDVLGRVRIELDRPGRWIVHLAHKSFEGGAEPGWTLFQSTLLLSSGP
jgi:hypothetical protein